MVNAETLFHGLRLVIISQDETAAAFIADAFLLCRRIYHVVGCPAVHTCAASGHTVYNIVIRHFYVDRIIHFLIQGCQGFVQRLCLGDCSRETVQYVSACAVFLIHPVYYQVYHQLVRYKQSLIHIGLGFLSKLRPVFDICSENVSCRDVRNRIFFGNFLCLCSFARSGSA